MDLAFVLKTLDGKILEYDAIHGTAIGLEDNKLTAPGSGPVEMMVYIGVVEGKTRVLIVDELYHAYLLDKAPYDVEIMP
jgi:hypothetical protein